MASLEKLKLLGHFGINTWVCCVDVLMVCVDKTNKLVSRGFEDLTSMKCLWAWILNFGILNCHISSINKQTFLDYQRSSIQTY